MILAIGEQVCRSAIWERIGGWQVVLAVSVIVIAWTLVQLGRMYYMALVAKDCPHSHVNPDDSP